MTVDFTSAKEPKRNGWRHDLGFYKREDFWWEAEFLVSEFLSWTSGICRSKFHTRRWKFLHDVSSLLKTGGNGIMSNNKKLNPKSSIT